MVNTKQRYHNNSPTDRNDDILINYPTPANGYIEHYPAKSIIVAIGDDDWSSSLLVDFILYYVAMRQDGVFA